MLTHSVRQGLAVPSADLDTIVRARDLLSEGKPLDAATRVQFLGAYQRLAQIIKPASVVSLSAVIGHDGKPRGGTRGGRAVRRYTVLGLATFLVLAVIQVFWITGSGLVRDVNDAKAQFDAASVQFSPYAPRVRAPIPGQKLDPLPPEEQTKMERLETEVQNSLEFVRGYDSALNQWNRLASWPLDLIERLHITRRETESERIPIHYLYVMDTVEKQRLAKDLAGASFALQALQTFALPFVYGLLGVSIYILRRLSSEIRLLTYEPINHYRLRIPIEALAGVAIGWMFSVQDANNLAKTLPAFALSFLAGYSVEFLFTTLDRLVGAFAKETSEKRKTIEN